MIIIDIGTHLRVLIDVPNICAAITSDTGTACISAEPVFIPDVYYDSWCSKLTFPGTSILPVIPFTASVLSLSFSYWFIMQNERLLSIVRCLDYPL